MLNKLVKDKVLTNMQDLGQKITYHRLTDEEFLPELKKKLLEEAQELNATNSDVITELADLLEVIEQIAAETGTDIESLKKVQSERKKKRGGFDNRIYVERLDLADDDPWVKYYAAEPNRFPEPKNES